jgi:anti-anti-sigma regulatory factor
MQETVWVRTGSRLDLASLDMIQEAIRSVRVDLHHTESLVIDMKNTRQVFDSGIELLLFLYRKAGTRRNNLYIVNAGSRVRERLGEKGLDACFHLPKSPLNRPAGN